MRLTLIFSLVIVAIFAAFSFLTSYRSAFEADQACHFDILQSAIEDGTLGCDHDLETRQWLLYNKGSEVKSATVIKRYRY